MFRLEGKLGLLHQGKKGFLQHILRLAVAQAQRPAIENQFRSLPFIKPQTPVEFHLNAHGFNP